MSHYDEETCTQIPSNKLINSLSFSCGGWLFIYMFGVAKCLQDHKLHKNITCIGCSAGALTAAGLCLNGNFDKATEFCRVECVRRAYSSIFGIFKIAEYVSECLDISVDLKKCVNLEEGQLRVAYTALPFMEKRQAMSYTCGDDLKKYLLASSAAFPLAPLVYHRGEWLVDGGYSDFQPLVSDSTITVSPLYFSTADIRPSRYVPLWWAFLPPCCESTVDWLFELGYYDTVKWLQERRVAGISPTLHFPSLQPRRSKHPSHPYHTPGQVTMHRFLGFDPGEIMHSYFTLLLDLGLYILVTCVWRPLAVSLIFGELLVMLVVHLCYCIYAELYNIWSPLPYLIGAITPQLWTCYMLTFVLVLTKAISISECRESRLAVILQHGSCIFSLSLMRRYIPVINTPYCPLNKHVYLLKLSFVYRLVRHFV